MAGVQLPEEQPQLPVEQPLRVSSMLDYGWGSLAPSDFFLPFPAPPSPSQLLEAAAASPRAAWAGLGMGMGMGFSPGSLHGSCQQQQQHFYQPQWLQPQPVSPWRHDQPAVSSATGQAATDWGSETGHQLPVSATTSGLPMTTAASAEPQLEHCHRRTQAMGCTGWAQPALATARPVMQSGHAPHRDTVSQPPPRKSAGDQGETAGWLAITDQAHLKQPGKASFVPVQRAQAQQAQALPSELTPELVLGMTRVNDIRAALTQRGLDTSGYKVALRRRLWLAVGGRDADPNVAPNGSAPPCKTPAGKAAGQITSHFRPAKFCPANPSAIPPNRGRRSTAKQLAPLPTITFGPWKAGPSECEINSRIPDDLVCKIIGMVGSAKEYGRAIRTCRRWWALGSHAAVRASFASEIKLLKYAVKMTHPALAGSGQCPDAVVAAVFSPTGDEIFGALDDDDGTVRIWDSSPGADLEWVAAVEHHEGVTSLAVTADSLIVGTFEGSIACWDTSADVIAQLWTVSHDSDPVCCIDASVPGAIHTDQSGDAIARWEAPRPRWRVPENIPAGTDPAAVTPVSPGLRVPPECSLRFVSKEDSPGHNETMRAVHIDIERRLLYSGSYDMTVKCWTLEGRCVDTMLDCEATPNVLTTRAAILVVGTDDGRIRLFRMATARAHGAAEPYRHELYAVYRKHTCVHALAFCAGYLFSGGKAGVGVWRVLDNSGTGFTLAHLTTIKTRGRVTSLSADERTRRIAVTSQRSVAIYQF